MQFLPHEGSLVLARGECWQLDARTLHADCAELHLRNASSGCLVLLSPFDRIVAYHRDRRVRAVRLRAWAAEMRSCANGPKVGRLRVQGATAKVIPYQLSPSLAAAAGTPRLFLADEVGLGKTIQAGWIVADALARHRDARVLIAVPAGLRNQWRTELSAHFDIDALVADARWLRRTFADLPADVSPWALPGVYLTSLDFIKRPDVVRMVECQVWDLLVVDEIHTAAAPTERHSAIDAIARRSRCLVMISATPYSGDPRSFESLARLGATPGSPAPVMFRRSREDVGALGGRRHRFMAVRITRAEHRLQRLMERYSREVWREAPADGDAVRLAMTVLRKRALSSPWAALRSLERRLDLLSRGARLPAQLRLFEEDEDALADEEPSEALATPGLSDQDRERRWLITLIEVARGAASGDSKQRFLERLLHRIRGDSAIVFTEYRDTLAHLAASLPGAALLHGGMPPHERSAVQRRFNAAGGLLLATDAASEGLNLQGRCRFVVNYELPWNPARLEQRIGRVDRIGQRRPVHALTLVARDTAEDLVIARLVRRLHRISATLGVRDRLAAFLDEARTAGIVIGDVSSDEAPGDIPVSAVTLAPDERDASADEAARLSVTRPAGRRSTQGDTLVSTIPCSSHLPEGFLFVVRRETTIDEGGIVDTDVVLIHVADAVGTGPIGAAAARRQATAAIDRYAPVVRSIAEDRTRVRSQETATAHAAILTRLMDRERALFAQRQEPFPLQPGLFDRRAIQRADEAALAANGLAQEHVRRLELLERSMTLKSRCEVVGVLIVGRRRA